MTSPSSRLPTLLGVLVMVMLLAYAFGTLTYIVPTLQAQLAAWGATLSLPSRLAIAIGDELFLILPFLVLAIVGAQWRARKAGAPGSGNVVIHVINVLMAAWILLQGWIFVDYARAVPN